MLMGQSNIQHPHYRGHGFRCGASLRSIPSSNARSGIYGSTTVQGRSVAPQDNTATES
ncbi:hypothetical protein WG66_013459, partial [Moniliophthora roreri]